MAARAAFPQPLRGCLPGLHCYYIGFSERSGTDPCVTPSQHEGVTAALVVSVRMMLLEGPSGDSVSSTEGSETPARDCGAQVSTKGLFLQVAQSTSLLSDQR